MRTSRARWVGAAAVIGVGLTGCAELGEISDEIAAAASSSPTGSASATPDSGSDGGEGYDLECGPGHGCSFGQRWTDDTAAPLGHNGCDTRNDVLRRDLTSVVLKPGSRGCVVQSGVLQDRYTGDTITFSRSRPTEVHVDHIVARKWVWDRGASTWPESKRAEFANDPRNLVATVGRVNSSKGDDGPADWLARGVMSKDARCFFARKFHSVATEYKVAVPARDQAALNRTIRTDCTHAGS